MPVARLNIGWALIGVVGLPVTVVCKVERRDVRYICDRAFEPDARNAVVKNHVGRDILVDYAASITDIGEYGGDFVAVSFAANDSFGLVPIGMMRLWVDLGLPWPAQRWHVIPRGVSCKKDIEPDRNRGVSVGIIGAGGGRQDVEGVRPGSRRHAALAACGSVGAYVHAACDALLAGEPRALPRSDR